MRRPCATIGVVAMLLLTTVVTGQAVTPEGRPPAAATPGMVPPAVTQAPITRGALLREGSSLLRVNGRVVRDDRRRASIFVVDAEDGRGAPHRFTVMPNTLLWELEQIVRSMPEDDLSFEVTGQVFVYRNRNYLMLTHPPRLVGRSPISTAAPAAAEEPTAAPESGASDSAEDIIRALEEDVGPVARRPVADTAPIDTRRRWREGEFVLDRLGGVRRSGDGSFIFLFTADADGLADPPMTILPCLQLERLERTLHQRGATSSVLISGNVHTYDGRDFLLPTLYRIPPRPR